LTARGFLLLKSPFEMLCDKELGERTNSTSAILVQSIFNHKCRVLFGALAEQTQQKLFGRRDLHGDQFSAAEERGHQIVRIFFDKSIGNDDRSFELEVQSNSVQFNRVIQYFVVYGDDNIGLGVRGMIVLEGDSDRFVEDLLRVSVICADDRTQLQLGFGVNDVGL
jgi:hypothetical protein